MKMPVRNRRLWQAVGMRITKAGHRYDVLLVMGKVIRGFVRF